MQILKNMQTGIHTLSPSPFFSLFLSPSHMYTELERFEKLFVLHLSLFLTHHGLLYSFNDFEVRIKDI